MARMLPPEISSRTQSPAEIYLFPKLRDELNDDWVVLHSVGVRSGRRKPWSEIDFVCISNSGVYCIEVKGGRITRRGSIWVQTNRHGEEFILDPGPFEQVAGASTALHRFLSSQQIEAIQQRQTVVGYGVAMPDVMFDVESVDVDKRLVYDVNDIQQPFTDYLDKLGNHWHSTFLQSDGIDSLISPIAVQQIIQQIRGDFDLRPSLNHRVGQIEEELLQLTEEQYELLDRLGIEDNPRILVKGGAGTGKTLCAVEMARHHAMAGKKTLLCCFNRALANHLRVMTADLDLITVSNFHDLMEDMVKEAGLYQALSRDDLQEYYRTLLPEGCKEALIQLDKMDLYEAVILDEGQDLMLPDYMEVLDAILKGGLQNGGWVMFWDPNQNIYDGMDDSVLEMLLSHRPINFRLTKNCRNTRQIADLVSLLSGIELEESVDLDGIEVEPQWYRDQDDQQRKVSRYVNRLLGEGIDPSDIVILSPRRLEHSSLKNGLIDVPFPLVWWEDTGLEQYKDQRHVTFSTLHAFKGLESKIVILCDVEDLETENSRHQLYVGSSRGRAILAPFISDSQRGTFTDRSNKRTGQ